MAMFALRIQVCYVWIENRQGPGTLYPTILYSAILYSRTSWLHGL
jgi:hypothetical protein